MNDIGFFLGDSKSLSNIFGGHPSMVSIILQLQHFLILAVFDESDNKSGIIKIHA